jgi:outer membrane protein assembly factor BamE (lipoprotein component of BamABCDE complex)
MARTGRRRQLKELLPLAAIGLLALQLGACTANVAAHGHRLDAAALAQVEPGRSSQREVVQLLGSPSSLATFDNHTWYYISQRTERRSFYQEKIVAQDVVAIRFDDQGLVSQIDRHGLDEAREIEVVDRETPTAGNELTILEQFIGNIGRFNPPSEEEDDD